MTVYVAPAKALLGRHPWRVLLGLLVVSILTRAALGDTRIVEVGHAIVFWIIFMGTIEVAGASRTVLNISRLTLIIWIVPELLSIYTDDSILALNLAVLILNVLIAVGVVIYTFKELLATRTADIDSVVAAIFGYLLIAVGFALVYAAMAAGVTGAFNFNEGAVNFSTFLYFSLVTMTTLGYGDIVPLTDFVRVLAGLQAVFGTLYFAVFIGAIVGRL